MLSGHFFVACAKRYQKVCLGEQRHQRHAEVYRRLVRPQAGSASSGDPDLPGLGSLVCEDGCQEEQTQ